jgi:hypothetical protein
MANKEESSWLVSVLYDTVRVSNAKRILRGDVADRKDLLRVQPAIYFNNRAENTILCSHKSSRKGSIKKFAMRPKLVFCVLSTCDW